MFSVVLLCFMWLKTPLCIHTLAFGQQNYLEPLKAEALKVQFIYFQGVLSLNLKKGAFPIQEMAWSLVGSAMYALTFSFLNAGSPLLIMPSIHQVLS